MERASKDCLIERPIVYRLLLTEKGFSKEIVRENLGGIIMERQVYLASDIQKALGIGKTKTYEFLNAVYKQEEPPFRVIKVGNSVRVIKQSFDNWMNATKC